MTLEKKSTEIIGDILVQCHFCICQFGSKRDLAIHLQAYGADRAEHIRQLDRAHRGADSSFRGTMAKQPKDEHSTKVKRSFI